MYKWSNLLSNSYLPYTITFVALGGHSVFRTSTFAARRQGGAVQSISAESDKTALLRFFGYMHRLGRLPQGQLLTCRS